MTKFAVNHNVVDKELKGTHFSSVEEIQAKTKSPEEPPKNFFREQLPAIAAPNAEVRSSNPGLGKGDSAFHSGSINEYQACLGTELPGVLRRTDRLNEASAHAPQSLRSRKLSDHELVASVVDSWVRVLVSFKTHSLEELMNIVHATRSKFQIMMSLPKALVLL
ncbi:hypothetical protein TNCV_871241 [Trichonephila clavipes]|nr:hypothetical protein TNCV_871241 [Trichonephila clavipes]